MSGADPGAVTEGAPAEPTGAPSGSRRLDLVTALVVAAGLALHVRFCLVDERAPTDLGQYYTPFRNLVLGWRDHGAVDWRVVDTPYSLLLAALGALVPPSVATMELVDGAWLLLLLVGTASVARAVGGPLAGAVAAIAVVGFPQTHVLARTHWIHHPEAAALIGAVALWLRAPGFTRGWLGPVGVGALLFVGETIRQTGLPFGVPLGLLVVVVGWRRGARARLVPVLVGVLAGIAWHGPSLALYVSRKAASAGQYAMSVGSPWPALGQNLGLPVLVWALPLAVVTLVALRSRDLRAAVVALSVLWIAGGLVAVGIFHVGADNFPLAAVALALLAGIGAASVPRARRVVVTVAVLGALVLHVPPLLRYETVRDLPRVFRAWAAPGPLNYLRVYWNPINADAVLPVVDRVCAGLDPTARCYVLASRGLFNPSWEDGGTFALFLAGRPRVTVLTPEVLWRDDGGASGVEERVHALVDVRCAPGVGPSTGGRFQAQTGRMQAMLRMYAEQSIATFGDPKACVQTWYALPPGGVLVQ